MAIQPFEIGHITIGKPHLPSHESNAKERGLSNKEREICRHVARMGEMRNAYRMSVENLKVRGHLSDVHLERDNINVCIRYCEGLDRICFGHGRV
jgi:hypothetical protein